MDVTYIKHHNGVVHQSGGLCAVSISIEGLDLNIKRVKCRHMFKNLLSLMLLFLILKFKKNSASLLILMKFSYSRRFVYISKIKFVFVADCICQVWKNVFARIGSLSG